MLANILLRLNFVLAKKHKLQPEHRDIGLRYRHRPRFDSNDANYSLAWEAYPILVRYSAIKLPAPLEMLGMKEEEWRDIIQRIIFGLEDYLVGFADDGQQRHALALLYSYLEYMEGGN